MLKDAALLTLDICEELIKHGLILQDAYPWNIFFDGAKPVFIDVGSIVKSDNDIIWRPYQQFCNFFLFPLYVYSAKYFKTGRPFLLDYLNGMSDTSCTRYCEEIQDHASIRILNELHCLTG